MAAEKEDLHRDGGKWFIGNRTVEIFIENQINENKKETTKNYENHLDFLPTGTARGKEVKLAKHLVIPWEFINEQITEYAHFVQKNRETNGKFFYGLKQKLQRILKHKEIQADFAKHFNNVEKVPDVNKEAAERLKNYLLWYPENLFIGPERNLRSSDSAFLVDIDILEGLTQTDDTTFLEFDKWIHIDQQKMDTDGLENLRNGLVKRDWKVDKPEKIITIIDVLYSLNNTQRRTYGPLWHFKNGNWYTNKTQQLIPSQRNSLVRYDLTNVTQGEDEKLKRVVLVDIETGETKIEYVNQEEMDKKEAEEKEVEKEVDQKEQDSFNQDEDTEDGYETGIEETNSYVNLRKKEIIEDSKKAVDLKLEYDILESSAKDVVKCLDEIANCIDDAHKKCNENKKLGVQTAMVGGVITVVGGIATIFSAGATIPLVLGGLTSLTGSVLNIKSTFNEASETKTKMKEVEDKLTDFKKLYNDFVNRIEGIKLNYISIKEISRTIYFVNKLYLCYHINPRSKSISQSSKKLPLAMKQLVEKITEARFDDLIPSAPISSILQQGRFTKGAVAFIKDADYVIVENTSTDMTKEKTSILRKKAEKELGKEVSKEVGNEIGLEVGKEIGKEAGKEVGKEAGKEVGKQFARGVATVVLSGAFLAWDYYDLTKLYNDKGSDAAKEVRKVLDEIQDMIDKKTLGAQRD